MFDDAKRNTITSFCNFRTEMHRRCVSLSTLQFRTKICQRRVLFPSAFFLFFHRCVFSFLSFCAQMTFYIDVFIQAKHFYVVVLVGLVYTCTCPSPSRKG